MAVPESPFTPPVRILVADGNDDLRDYVKRQMGGFYEVDLASDGAAALLVARANPPDLLLADVMAPELGGFGLLKEWRADPRLRHIPVILLSARAGEESRIEALTAGASDYLVKPFNARELLARVSICLEIARENRTSLEREQGLRISAEKSEAQAKEALAVEVTSTNRLHELSTRPLMKTEFQPLLEEVLAATVALQNADFGCVQLYNPATRSLQIVVQQGFKPDFLEYFRDCHDETTICGRALLQGARVIVEDILVDEDFAPHCQVALAAGYRAVQSSPIFSSKGEPLGVISTYFQQAHRPTARELCFTDLYAHLAAEVMERRRAEEALRSSEARFRSLLQGLPAAVYTCDAAGYITFFNEAAAALWGRRPELKSERWCGSLRMFRPDGSPVALDLCPMALVLRDGGTLSGEELIIERPDGTRRTVMACPEAIRDDSGQVAGAVNMVLDITGYKAAQQALQKSEDRFRQYFELGLIGMAITSPAKRILEVNDELCRILGYERSELLQKTWAELTHPDDLAADVAQFHRVLAGEFDGYTLDKRWIRKDGQVIDSIMAANCLRRADGSVDYFVGLVQDITKRKRAEEKVRESEERFRGLVESIPHHVWSFRKDGTPGYWNQRLADYTGLTAEQLKQGGWGALHPDDVERVREAWRKAWADETPYEMEQRIRGRDGRYRRFVCRADPISDSQGRFVEWFGTSTDVEERRRAQEELHHAQSELFRVTRLTSLGELAAGIAHEVNQPLGAIVNNANVSLQLANGETAAARQELREVLSDIVNDANRASAIIAHMRGLMKQVAPGREPLQLADLVRDVLALAEREIAEHRITVRTEIPNELPPISADLVQMQQVLFNLVMNGIEALSATETSRRVLTIGGQDATLNDRSAVQITVRDLGCGFGTQDPEHLFESFYTTKPHGLGMGLRISRSIVEAHGGKLWARMNEDVGAIFFCLLPAVL